MRSQCKSQNIPPALRINSTPTDLKIFIESSLNFAVPFLVLDCQKILYKFFVQKITTRHLLRDRKPFTDRCWFVIVVAIISYYNFSIIFFIFIIFFVSNYYYDTINCLI